MNRNQKYAAITLDYIQKDIGHWMTASQNDTVADAIVRTVCESELAKLALTRITGPLEDSQIEAHLRRGWAYAKVLYGYEMANQLAAQAGSILAVASAITLVNYEQTTESKGSSDFLQDVAFIPTACYVLVDLIAEHSGMKGETISPNITAEVPMTDRERDTFIQYCQSIDHSELRKHLH